jgi:hypothetical protein
MNMHCIEVVVYKVKNAQTAAAARRAIRPHIEAFPGFLGWHAVTSAEDPSVFTDIITWKSLAHARAAGEKVMSDPECAPFMGEIGEVVSMGHYL